MTTRTFRKLTTSVLLILTVIMIAAANIEAGPGDLDPTFSGDGKLTDWEGFATGVVIQPDGKIVVAFGPNFSVARYNPDGSRDIAFGNNGRASASFGSEYALALGIAIQSDEKIVVAGYVCPCDDWGNEAFAVARFNPDGSLDVSFDGDGKVTTAIGGRTTGYSVTVQPDNKIIVAGWSWEAAPPYMKDHFAVARYNPDGSLDTTFGGDGTVTTSICANCHDEAFSVAVQPDGKIVAVGGGFDGTNYPKFEVVRYNANGSLDTTFDSDGRLTTTFGDGQIASAVAIQGDGKIMAGGVKLGPSSPEFALARYNSNGSLDTTFDSDGKVTTNMGFGGGASSIAIQSDEKVIALGSVSVGFDGNYSDFAIARYNQDGSLDSTYSGGIAVVDFDNPNDGAFAMALDNAGRAVVVGESSPNIAIARLLVAPESTIFDFDGDGRSDISVFRPSDRVWYLNQSTAGFSATQFGLSTDKITPADFDGDGKTDIAVFRAGTWWSINSGSSTVATMQFGIADDIPVPADYSGDGQDELAIYRHGTWWIHDISNGQTSVMNFGLSTDKPVPADYDGDGRADQAGYRNGEWHINRSSQGYTVIRFGLATDKPVVGDYDGDGREDQAVYRDGTWYLLQSSQGFAAFPFGIASDVPAPADYDGDGRTDAAVYRDGVWYQRQSTGGISIQGFGLAGDKPVPAAFVP